MVDKDKDDDGWHECRAVIVDKGCQGIYDVKNASISKKKQVLRIHFVAEKSWNRMVASDCNIVENGFGRVSGR